MRLFLIILLSISSATAIETGPLCGEYDINGIVVVKATGEAHFVSNQGTISEMKFKLNELQELKLSPYINRSAKIRAVITKKMNGKIGEFSEIVKADYALPDPAQLAANHTISLVKKGLCR